MASHADKYLSIKLTRFYMKVVGFWYADNKCDEWILNAILTYTVLAVIFGTTVEIIDVYYSWGDFTAITYNMCVTIPLIVIGLKVTIFYFQRKDVFDLIIYSEKNFWNATYDEYGKKILEECESKGVTLSCILSFATQGTCSAFVIVPLFGNIGKNETDRDLPFRICLDLPTQTTPYFEIIFILQTLSAIHSGICFFCFDNLMGILNIHVVGQFKILRHRLENLCDEYANSVDNKIQCTSNVDPEKECPVRESFDMNLAPKMQNEISQCRSQETLEKTQAELKKCVKQHLLLIDFVKKLESGFSLMLLFQMGGSSLIICMGGFQVFVAKNGIFILHLTSGLSQILLFTWTCNEIIINSMEIGDAAFRSKWYMLPCTGAGYTVRHGLMMIMIRARRACYVSAGKFTPMSLKSFTNILSTTLSYLSLLRQLNDEIN